MAISKGIIRQVFAAATEEFKRVGFRKRTPGIFTRDLNEHVAGWVGLNIGASQADAVSVGPVVGVRHQRLEATVSGLLGLTPSRFITPSIGTNIGYLSSEQRYWEWTFAFENLDDLVTDMVSTIMGISLPFMEKNADLANLSATLIDASPQCNGNVRSDQAAGCVDY